MKIATANGYSLVEILISLAISTIILTAMVQSLASLQQLELNNQGVAWLQDANRVALHQLSKSIKNAGYQGCRTSTGPIISASENSSGRITSQTSPWLRNGQDHWQDASLVAIPTSSAQWADNTPLAGTNSANRANTNSDVLFVQFASTESLEVAVDTPGLTAKQSGLDIGANELGLLTDCHIADIVQLPSAFSSSQRIQVTLLPSQNPGLPLRQFHPSLSRLHRLDGYAFFTSSQDTPSGRPTLYRIALKAGAIPAPIAEGVEQIHFQFGIRDDTGVLQFFTSEEMQNQPSHQVSQVRVGIVYESIKSIAESTSHAQPLTLWGKPLALATISDDGRLRKTLTTTVMRSNVWNP